MLISNPIPPSTSGGGTPGGNNTEVQFNDAGSFAGDSTYTFNKTTHILTVQGITSTFTGNLTGNVTGNVTGSSGSCTGNAATVTTNANLTGHVTSTGNAAVLGSFTVAQLSTAISDADISGTNTGDQTSVSGNAGSSTTIAITDDTTTNSTMYPTWVTANTGNLANKVSSTKLSFNPSTATLTTTTFSGALSGNATTATTATTATNATNTAVTDDTTTNAPMYVTWKTANTGNLPDKVSSTKLSFNPSTGLLTSTGFSGPLTGNVTGNASGSSGSCTGNAGTVTTNANLTGIVTSTGNATAIADGAISNAKLANAAVANLSGTNTGDQTNIAGNAATVTTNANLTGHVTSTGNAAVLGSFTVAQLSTAISDANISGTNTGDQTITLTGDVSGSGTGSFAVTSTKVNGANIYGMNYIIVRGLF